MSMGGVKIMGKKQSDGFSIGGDSAKSRNTWSMSGSDKNSPPAWLTGQHAGRTRMFDDKRKENSPADNENRTPDDEKMRRKEAKETMRRLERERMPFETQKEYEARMRELDCRDALELDAQIQKEVDRDTFIGTIIIIVFCLILGLVGAILF